ncbi:MAG: hypothetical protein ACREBW_01980 [Candidatus Micrarchaeaceae archaeon]
MMKQKRQDSHPFLAVNSIHDASRAVRRLRERVDPGHIPLRLYLDNLAKDLSHWADELEARINEESGV